MAVIHKDPLEPGSQVVQGRPVSVGMDGANQPSVWFQPGEPHRLQVVPTGREFEPIGPFLGTIVFRPEGLVFHVFRTFPG